MAAETKKIKVTFQVNGKRKTVNEFPFARLLDVLRENCNLSGTKEGCGEGECGACSVLLDGKLVNSCLVPLAQVNGSQVVTIEGLAKNGKLHPVQKAFLDHGGAQCGICTPGMILASTALLKKFKRPKEAEIREGLAGNLCRCTGYVRIVAAVKEAAKGRAR